MPDEDRVFDVTRPSRVSPIATSKPVIAGHMAMISDPMVKDSAMPEADSPTAAKIPVTDGDQPSDMANGIMETTQPEPAPEPVPITIPDSASEPAPVIDAAPAAPSHEDTQDTASANESPVSGVPGSSPMPDGHTEHVPKEDDDIDPDQPIPQIQGISVVGPKPKKRWLGILLVILVLLVGAYLFIDSGVVDTGINLPLHVFKQTKTPATLSVVSKPSSNSAASSTASVPQGFKQYNLAGTGITFAAPITWGDATSSTEQGYAIRGGSNQPSGTYAYLVNFANNKDVQIAVTSNKFLPPARGALYYDFLKWCLGTSDGKYYQSTLKFTTADKVDTPTTVTCDQGPLINPLKLDPSTIVESKATDSAKAIIGDVYTKNLNDPQLVVLRVKDTAMTNGNNVKLLLGTVKLSNSQAQ